MICDFCRIKILESGESWGYHHNDTSEFAKAATGSSADPGEQQGCMICCRLAHDLSKDVASDNQLQPSIESLRNWFEPTDTASSHGRSIAVYEWTFRKAVKIDETESSFILTFRPSAVPDADKSRYRTRNSLPQCLFYLFLQEDLRENYIVAGKLSQNTGNSWAQIKKWLNDCSASDLGDRTHRKCRSVAGSFVPTRLVDVRLGQELHDGIRLPIINTKSDFTNSYLTLSHCWGKEPYPFPQLKKATWVEYTGDSIQWQDAKNRQDIGVPWKDIQISRNFAEAITVARQLAVGYIWIDSLCIIQDDAEDWEEQALLMHLVYRFSHCNIAASSAKSPNDGLFRVRHEAFEGQATTSVSVRGEIWQVVPGDLWEKDLLGSSLYTRGWVYQERMLSPRMLHFGTRQIFWDCSTVSSCEIFPFGIPRQLENHAAIDRSWRGRLQTHELKGSITDATHSLKLFWRNAVREYTSCDLSLHKDKLKAIWGIAKLVRDIRKSDYAAGLWNDDVVGQLAWTVIDNTKASRNLDAAPSWSWASIQKGTIDIGHQSGGDLLYTVMGHTVEENVTIELQKPQQEVTPYSSSDSVVHSLGFRYEDKEPELKNSDISLTGLVTLEPISLKRLGHDQYLGLVLQGQIDEVAGIRAYADVPIAFGACSQKIDQQAEAVLLSALEEETGTLDQDGNPHYMPHGVKVYSGRGLLVRKMPESLRYSRIGVFSFEKLPQAVWLEFCGACGQDVDPHLRLDSAKYRKILLS